MVGNKSLNPVETELCIRGRKLNIYHVFITKFYFAVPIFMNHYKKCPKKLCIRFYRLILLLHQIIFYVLEKIFNKKYKD